MFFIQNFASSCITHSWIVEQSYSVVVLASPPFTARPEMLMNLQYVLYYIYIYIYIYIYMYYIYGYDCHKSCDQVTRQSNL